MRLTEQGRHEPDQVDDQVNHAGADAEAAGQLAASPPDEQLSPPPQPAAHQRWPANLTHKRQHQGKHREHDRRESP